MVLAVLFIQPGCAAKRYKSPSGKLEVSFTEKSRKIGFGYDFPYMDGQDDIIYTIGFHKAGAADPIAEGEYHDLFFGGYGEKPAGPRLLSKAIVWSPGEDFAVLPEEQWASAPHIRERTAVAVNPALGWKIAPFRMQTPIWIGKLTALGDYWGSCDDGVALFDGAKGEQKNILEPAPPIGYYILRSFAGELLPKGTREIYLAKKLDVCATDGDCENFKGECFIFDKTARKAVPAPCPDMGWDWDKWHGGSNVCDDRH